MVAPKIGNSRLVNQPGEGNQLLFCLHFFVVKKASSVIHFPSAEDTVP